MKRNVNIKKELPAKVVNELYRIARKYEQKGACLFIFGSFANATNRSTSDLDIGVLWPNKRSSRTFNKIYKDIKDLPTIRKIDLVDMGKVDDDFKTKVFSRNILLLNNNNKVN